MCDDRFQVQPAFQQHAHFVPGLIHFTAIDTANCKHVENHGMPIDGHFTGRNSQHGDASTVSHIGQHVAKGSGVAGHFQTHIEPFVHI